MMSASLRELRRGRWAAEAARAPGAVAAVSAASTFSGARAERPGLRVLVRATMAEWLTPRRPAHD
jgi:hypothetical protein